MAALFTKQLSRPSYQRAQDAEAFFKSYRLHAEIKLVQCDGEIFNMALKTSKKSLNVLCVVYRKRTY